jgi:hypothetical protein
MIQIPWQAVELFSQPHCHEHYAWGVTVFSVGDPTLKMDSLNVYRQADARKVSMDCIWRH